VSGGAAAARSRSAGLKRWHADLPTYAFQDHRKHAFRGDSGAARHQVDMVDVQLLIGGRRGRDSADLGVRNAVLGGQRPKQPARFLHQGDGVGTVAGFGRPLDRDVVRRQESVVLQHALGLQEDLVSEAVVAAERLDQLVVSQEVDRRPRLEPGGEIGAGRRAGGSR
jgi:hypothetical protein